MSDDLINKLSEIRSEYNCFDENEEPYYRALSEAIMILSQRADGDTISRQATNSLVDELARSLSNRRSGLGRGRCPGEIMGDILRLPSAQPEQKVSARNGHWVKYYTGHSTYYECSLCSCLAPCTEIADKYIWKLSNYCPDCGADLREEGEGRWVYD